MFANLFKINAKCHLSSIQKSQQICTSGGDVYYASRNLLSTCLAKWQVIFGQNHLIFGQETSAPLNETVPYAHAWNLVTKRSESDITLTKPSYNHSYSIVYLV